jgi:hypothetical protein
MGTMGTRLGTAVTVFLSGALLAGAAVASPRERDARSGVTDVPQGDVGYLTLACEPVANASIDGQAKGLTPLTKLALPVGAHQITLVSQDGKLKRTLGFKIVKGETTRLNVSLGP